MQESTMKKLARDELTPFEMAAETQRRVEHEYKECKRKVRVFDDETHARRTAEALDKYAYPCRFCKRWHMATPQMETAK
jgi:hypothetical protein